MPEEKDGATGPRLARTKKAVVWYLGALRFFYFQFPVTVVWAVGLVFTARVFQNYTRDTTSISNAAFAIVATLTALSFGCARAVEPEGDARERFTYAGERLFGAAVMLILASVVKYTMLRGRAHATTALLGVTWPYMEPTIGFMASVLFGAAVYSAARGVRVLTETLDARVSRHPEWGGWFF